MSLISVLIASLIVIFSFFVSSRLSEAGSKMGSNTDQALIAQSYASELAELFSSFTSDELKQYFNTNPFNVCPGPQCSCPGCQPYSLCSHINLLDREHSTPTTSLILNEDPIATLPDDLSINQANQKLSANRFFLISVINIKTFSIVDSLCSLPISSLTLGEDERFLVTVGVSWVPPAEGLDKLKRVSLATLIL